MIISLKYAVCMVCFGFPESKTSCCHSHVHNNRMRLHISAVTDKTRWRMRITGRDDLRVKFNKLVQHARQDNLLWSQRPYPRLLHNSVDIVVHCEVIHLTI